MFKFVNKIFNYKKEIQNLKNKLEDLRFDLRHSLSVTEKYLALMKVQDRIQLLILRKNLSDR